MSAFCVFYIHQITSPIGIVDAESETALSVYGIQLSAGHRGIRTTVDISLKRFSGTFPPPTPTDAVNLIFKSRTIYRFSFRIYGDDVKYMILICLDIFTFRLIEVDAYVRIERRKRNTCCIDTGISARFEYPGSNIGL